MRRRAFAIAMMCLATTAYGQVPVELRVVDQNGVDVRGATVAVDGGAAVPSGTTVQLVAGTHEFVVNALSTLSRSESAFVPPAATTLSFEWITSDVRLRFVDQNGANLPGSIARFLGGPPPGSNASSGFPSGRTVALPITDPAVYPTLSGEYANGYDLTVLAASSLQRDVLDRVVTATTNEIVVEWATSNVTLRVTDQNGTELAGAFVRLRHSGINGLRAGATLVSGTTLTLPVTDPALYPGLRGLYGDGYDFTVVPLATGGLRRNVDDRSTTVATSEIAFEWLHAECDLLLLDAVGMEVFGSTLQLPQPFGTITSGDRVRLPITDNVVYPTLFDVYATGFPITIGPADIAPETGTFRFEVAQDGQLSPADFTIGPNAYSLRSSTNAPPVADAGANVSIVSSAIAGTTLAANASDPDGDPLTYRWLEGAVELVGPTSVGAGGSAPLVLGAAPFLGVGSHTLTLEVSDGELTATDSTVLTIDNAAPEVVCTGGGTYAPGSEVTLAATVSDHDGDLLSYDWSSSGVLLTSGIVETNAGGAPAAVPPFTVPTGDLAAGLHTFTLTVQDAAGASARCEAEIQLDDSEGPTLAPVVSVSILWPANHRLVEVVIDANASDASGSPVTLSAVVQCSKNSERQSCGESLPDYTTPVIDQEAGRITLRLRAERRRRGDGRTYTVVITATDAAGHSTVAEVEVVAPHDRPCLSRRWKRVKERAVDRWKSKGWKEHRERDDRPRKRRTWHRRR